MSVGTCQVCGAAREDWDPRVPQHRPGETRPPGKVLRQDEKCPGSHKKSAEDVARPKVQGVRVRLDRL